MNPNHPDWTVAIGRNQEIYHREDDIRTSFGRDYTRILHSNAYRRLKHKTQVFFATQNDHICTRIEHVNHVASVSYTISTYLGLNTELVGAIATGHDLGHAPFGHQGEVVLQKLAHNINRDFWHERHSLRVVDEIDTILGPDGMEHNLGLTYAVRDGIISHCGEVDQDASRPRTESVRLETISSPNQYQPFTWEGCVVKISDKIAYLGRDIEDALSLRVIKQDDTRELIKLIKDRLQIDIVSINNTTLMHKFIISLCGESNPERGLVLSKAHIELMGAIKDFNYNHIYKHPRLEHYKNYAELIITSIYNVLQQCYAGEQTLLEIMEIENYYPQLGRYFREWLIKYSDVGREYYEQQSDHQGGIGVFDNKIIYKIRSDKDDFIRACIDFIAGMTDTFAERMFKELTNF